MIIIAIFSVANIGAVKDALAKEPWTYAFQWPGLDITNPAGDPLSSMTYNFNWLPAAGTLMVFAGILTAIVLRVSPARALQAYKDTYVELKWAIVTVMAVLALAYVMNQSGQTSTLGAWLAGAGGIFVFLSSILGWLGVAVTGSDTSSNALFGALQVQTAAKAGLDPLLLAAANSSGGVLGKMVSPQNLAIAAAAVGMAGQEGVIFRKVLGWSLVLLLFMCVLVTLQDSVLSWMVPVAPGPEIGPIRPRGSRGGPPGTGRSPRDAGRCRGALLAGPRAGPHAHRPDPGDHHVPGHAARRNAGCRLADEAPTQAREFLRAAELRDPPRRGRRGRRAAGERAGDQLGPARRAAGGRRRRLRRRGPAGAGPGRLVGAAGPADADAGDEAAAAWPSWTRLVGLGGRPPARRQARLVRPALASASRPT